MSRKCLDEEEALHFSPQLLFTAAGVKRRCSQHLGAELLSAAPTQKQQEALPGRFREDALPALAAAASSSVAAGSATYVEIWGDMLEIWGDCFFLGRGRIGDLRAEYANLRPGGRYRAEHSEPRANTRGNEYSDYSGLRSSTR